MRIANTYYSLVPAHIAEQIRISERLEIEGILPDVLELAKSSTLTIAQAAEVVRERKQRKEGTL